MRPFHADFSLSTEPAIFCTCACAFSSMAPLTSSSAALKSLAEAVPSINVVNAATASLSVSFRASPTEKPCFLSLSSPSSRSGSVFTGLPIAWDSLLELSARYRKMFRNAVAELEASKPEFAKTPRSVAVSRISRPIDFATGPTIGIAVLSFAKPSADLSEATARTLRASSVSLARRPKVLSVEPVKDAASASSTPIAVAKLRIAFCIDIICPCPKPSFASSVCNSVTCVAV